MRNHCGCFKCRCGYANHLANNCLNGFPAPESYKTLTDDILLSHKRNQKPLSQTSVKPVAAIEAVEGDSESDDGVAASSAVIAAVMPSTVLGSGSDSDSDEVCSIAIAMI